MICYFDASAFVKLVVPEAGSVETFELWERADRVLSSILLYPEGRSALARAIRSDRVDRSGQSQARRVLEGLWRNVDRIPVDANVTVRAGDLAQEHALRALDAVHLASAETIPVRDLVVVAADRALCDAAHRIELRVAPV